MYVQGRRAGVLWSGSKQAASFKTRRSRYSITIRKSDPPTIVLVMKRMQLAKSILFDFGSSNLVSRWNKSQRYVQKKKIKDMLCLFSEHTRELNRRIWCTVDLSRCQYNLLAESVAKRILVTLARLLLGSWPLASRSRTASWRAERIFKGCFSSR